LNLFSQEGSWEVDPVLRWPIQLMVDILHVIRIDLWKPGTSW